MLPHLLNLTAQIGICNVTAYFPNLLYGFYSLYCHMC